MRRPNINLSRVKNPFKRGTLPEELGEPRYRVVLVEDTPEDQVMYSELITKDPALELVTIVKYPELAGRILDQTRPDVAIIDFFYGPDHMTGVELAEQIRQKHPNMGLLLLTQQDNDIMPIYRFMQATRTQDAMKKGGQGFVIKGKDHKEFQSYVKTVAIGGEVKGEAIKDKYNLFEKLYALNPLDLEILRYLALGLSNKGIARKIATNPSDPLTVNAITGHIGRIAETLGIPEENQDGDPLVSYQTIV